MTLIQTLLTPTGVLQVSDRQLTYPDGRIHADPANKAVIWCGHMVVGFTGMAFTDLHQQRPISEWIALTLRGAITLGDACDALQQAGAHLMTGTAVKRRPLTLVLAGSPPGSGDVIMFAISNKRDGVSPPTGEGTFFRSNTLQVPLFGSQYAYKAVGVPISRQAAKQFEHELSCIHARFGVGHAARRMVAAQRKIRQDQIARRRGATIGRSAMIVSLPAAADPNPALTFITTNPITDAVREGLPMYSFVQDYGFSTARFGPHFVCGGAVGLDLQSGVHSPGSSEKPKQWSSIRRV